MPTSPRSTSAKPEVFVDTSAIYAVLVAEDQEHAAAKSALSKLAREKAVLVSSSFVVQECVALLQARIGLHAVRSFQESFVPLLNVVWVTESLYQRTMTRLLEADSRKVSLTDYSSFEIMRERKITRAFAIDKHFADRGFELLPGFRVK